MSEKTLQTIGWAMITLTMAIIVVGLVTPWGLGLDFANFYDAGHKALVGQIADLYNQSVAIDGQEPLGNMSFFSAPLTSYFFAPMAMLPPRTALFLFKLAGTAATVTGLLLLYRQLAPQVGEARHARAAYFAIFAGAVLLFQPFWTVYRVGGQSTPFVFLFFVLALLHYCRGQTAQAALFYGLAVLIKPAFAPGAILLFLFSDNRFRVSALVGGVLVAALSLAIFGPQLHLDFLDKIRGETRGLMDPTLNSNPFSFVEPWLVDPVLYKSGADAPQLVRTVGAVLRLSAAAVLLWGLWADLRAPLDAAARRQRLFHASLFLPLILSPVVWAHYLVMVFPLIAALLAQREKLPKAAIYALVVVLTLAVLQNRIIFLQLQAHFQLDNFAGFATLGLLKSLPLLVLMLSSFAWRKEFCAALNNNSAARL